MSTFIITYRIDNGEKVSKEFSKDKIMIGRAPDSDLCLDKVKGASRYHARLNTNGEKQTLVDLNSTNGTFVNGERIGTTAIRHGDIIHIGNATLTVSSDTAEAATEESSGEPSTQEVETLDNAIGEVSPILKKISQKAIAASSGHTGVHKVADEFLKTTLSSLLGPIWAYISDEAVSHVLVKGCDSVHIERENVRSKVGASFSPEEISNLQKHLCNECEVSNPKGIGSITVDIDELTQMTMILPPLVKEHAIIDVRKRPRRGRSVEECLASGFLPAEVLTFLKASMQLGKNIVVSGPRRCGKSNLLQILLDCAPDRQTKLLAQRSPQITSSSESVLAISLSNNNLQEGLLSTGIAALDCDLNIIDDIPITYAYEALELMLSQAPGFILSVEAGSPSGALARLESLAMTSMSAPGHIAVRNVIANSVDLLVQIQQNENGAFCVTEVAELPSLNANASISPVPLYHYIDGATADAWTGEVPSFLDDLERLGLVDALDLFTEVVH